MICVQTCEIQEASMADSASSSLAVMAHSAPTILPTACSVSVAFSAHGKEDLSSTRSVSTGALHISSAASIISVSNAAA